MLRHSKSIYGTLATLAGEADHSELNGSVAGHDAAATVGGMISRFVLLILGAVCAAAAPLSQHAMEYRAELVKHVLPYWLATVDSTNGGYLLNDDAVKGRGTPREKSLVSQARMVWTFAHVHHKGLDDAQGTYLNAARNGYHFLLNHFRDREHGGYFWKTDLAGKVTNERKMVYGESFVIYALVEYHRATRNPEPLQRALEVFRLLQQHAHDPVNGGWTEHFTRDWRPLPLRDPAGEVEVAGLKSANAHLHLMEALSELYQVTGDQEVRKRLAESLRINRTYFYPADAGKSCFHRQPDWKEVSDPRSAGLSYGHNVEFAWLMLRAQDVLGDRRAWKHFYAHIDHSLRHGCDHERGGLFNRGIGNEPASDRNKVWWVQAEMMAALADALQHKHNPDYERALDQLVHFVNRYQADPRDRIWVDTVAADGQPKSPGKAHGWKANYHDVRALVKFIEAFDAARPAKR